ncbi:hypothetical protein H311_00710 [Anncaliia algerae PRA109]|nr:hypothetical protein H311_00710 [Anncaliia algerae PRA109]
MLTKKISDQGELILNATFQIFSMNSCLKKIWK